MYIHIHMYIHIVELYLKSQNFKPSTYLRRMYLYIYNNLRPHLQPFQNTETHCNTPQRLTATKPATATHCDALRRTATHCSTFGCHHSCNHRNTLRHTATRCNTLQHTATHCNTLQHTATTHWITLGRHCTCSHRNTLQHTATHCNTLQQHTGSHWAATVAAAIVTHCGTLHVLQQAATHCNSLQQTATQCNTPGRHHSCSYCN